MSKKKESAKAKVFQALHDAGRRYSDATVLFHELIAQAIGLAGADHKYLGILLRNGSMTAGELAAHTGLTTGAITGVIDRLEQRGLVQREKDASDRRKVVIVPNAARANELLGPVFGMLLEKLGAVYSRFTVDELTVVLKYLEETEAVMREVGEQIGKDGQ